MTHLLPAERPAVPTAAPPVRLLGPDGEPLRPGDGGGWVAPHALNFAAVINTVSKTYSYRWDEALKDSPANALAMKRDAYYLGLLQERVAPTATRNWTVKVDKRYGGKGEWVAGRLTEAVRAVPDLTGLLLNQLDALWYGRAGSQILPGRAAGGVWTVTQHVPVNGDKIQYAWDRTPVVMVSSQTAAEYRDERGTIVSLDRGGWGLKLDRPEFRQRFVIHHHVADDADYFQGEMAGGAHGVGLRSRVYWSGWMKTETLGWMLSFMQGVGMMDLIVLNYPSGNPEAKRKAEENAKKITNGLALLVARGPEERGYPAVEQVSLNHAGVKVLQDLIASYFDRHIERLFVGQSMSSGADSGDGLGGTGRAKFAQDTKFNLLKMDAERLGETITGDLLPMLKARNCPGCEDIPARFEFAIPDPSADDKLNTVSRFIDKMAFKKDEVYELIGMTQPGPHDETVGGPAAGGMPGMPGGGMPGQPPEPGGRAATSGDDTPNEDELHPDLLAEWGGVETYAAPDQWQPYTVQAGPRNGQQVYQNQRTGELRDAPPGRPAAPEQPNAVQRGIAAVQAAGARAKGAVGGAIDRVPGGKLLKGLGAGAVKVFHAVEKPLMAAMASTQQLARQAAYERGMGDEQVDVLGRVLFLADFAGGYGGAAVGYAVAGPVGGKVGSFMPTASVLYLAYSTARDPLATWRAAKRLVRAKLATAGRAATNVGAAVARGADAAAGALDRVSDLTQRAVGMTGFEAADVPEFYALTPDLAGRLADGLKGAPNADWWQACVTAGIGETRDPERALSLAPEMSDDVPVPDGAEIGAAMIHAATMGQWDAVDALGDEIGAEGEDDGPERYARTAAKWTPFQHKSGKPAWRSAGGLVRFTDPTAGKGGAQTGRAATPEGPGIPKRLEKQRANQDAQRRAVDITNRLAQGHPPSVDELAGLPDLLKSLTSAQLLALNKTVGGHGGKLKADRIAHFLGKVNDTLAAARPAEPKTADTPRPRNGLVMLRPEERSDYVPPEAPKPTETPAPAAGGGVAAVLSQALASNPQLSPERKRIYGEFITDATKRMPSGATAAIARHLRGAKYHRSPREIAASLVADSGEQKYLTVGDIRGAYRQKTGTLYLDGDGGAGTYAHELAHVIDHGYRLSGSAEWRDAFTSEVDRDGAPLSQYARTSPSEGFAEFARLVYTGDVNAAEQRFPKSSAFFKRNDLWPTDQHSKTSSPGRPATSPTTTSSSTSTTPPPTPQTQRPTIGERLKVVAGRWKTLVGRLTGGPGA